MSTERDQTSARGATTYAGAVLVGSLVVTALAMAGTSHGTIARTTLVIAPTAILLAGGIGAMVQTFLVYRRNGNYNAWHIAGWFLLIAMVTYMAMSASALAG